MEIKKILVVRIRRVGDALLTLPLLYSLKETFPQATIDFVVNEPIDNLFLNQNVIDHLIKVPIDVDKGSLIKYASWVKKTVKKQNYDLIIDCRTTIKTMLFSLFSLGTKYRIGIKKKYNFLIHNYRVELDYNLTKIEELCSLLKPLESKYHIKKSLDLKLNVTPEEVQEAKKQLISGGVDLAKPIVFCNVASRDVKKQYPLMEMCDLLKRILLRYPSYQLILNYGSQKEKEVVLSLYAMLDKAENVFPNIEMNSLRDLVSVISISSFFWGNEGGARHIVDALKVPSFAIFSPGVSIPKWIRNKGVNNDAVSIDQVDEYCEKEGVNKNDYIWNILNKHLLKVSLSSRL